LSTSIKVAQYGVGAIGAEIVRFLARRPNVEIVAAVDNDPGKAGRDLGEIAGMERKLGVLVTNDPAEIRHSGAEIVTHSTSSYLPDVMLQITSAIEAGAQVVSTCEELAYPWERYPALARQLDEAAQRSAVTVLGTGINPGFVMDTFALVLAGTCQSVDSIEILRHVDVATRRVQLQQKVGAGLNLEAFQERHAAGRFGHVGLQESAWMIAAGLGWQIDDFEHTLEPVIAMEERESPDILVPPGYAAGTNETLQALVGGRPRITMHLRMELGAAEPRDEIRIHGTPNVDLLVSRGFQGDPATAAIIVNSLPHVIAARPGLLTMADLPLGFVRQEA
jgi:4-hydroxy-tetrahydrodipicolinate reductase